MKTVLFVDDELPVLSAIKRHIKRYPEIRCLFTCDVDTAIYLVDQVDLVVTDWTMPGGGGRAVVDKCQQMDVKAIVSSGDNPDNTGIHLTSISDVRWVKKTDLMELPDVVARALHLLDP